MPLELLPLTADAPYFMQAVAVYAEYVTGDPRYHTFLFQNHMGRQGYMGLVALLDERVIGFAFGSDSLSGQWWHERVLLNMDEDDGHHLENAWVLTQLNVLQAYRSQGVGGILHDALVAAQTRPNLVLSTPVTNRRAQRFYQRRGWSVLHRGFAFARGNEPFMILHLERSRWSVPQSEA